MAQLSTSVFVDGTWYHPGQDVPEHVASKITNPDAWAGDAPEPKPAAATPSAPPADADPDRPRGNASREEWAAYATSKGVEVTGTMSRDDIRAAVDRRVSA